MSALEPTLGAAIDFAVRHVAVGGLPFVGQLVDDAGYASCYGVNRVRETGDPAAHAEIVAIREALAMRGSVRGLRLLATGEPCGMCYRFAAGHGITSVHFAVGRDQAAAYGFDYRGSYAGGAPSLSIHRIPLPRALEPFEAYLRKELP